MSFGKSWFVLWNCWKERHSLYHCTGQGITWQKVSNRLIFINNQPCVLYKYLFVPDLLNSYKYFRSINHPSLIYLFFSFFLKLKFYNLLHKVRQTCSMPVFSVNSFPAKCANCIYKMPCNSSCPLDLLYLAYFISSFWKHSFTKLTMTIYIHLEDIPLEITLKMFCSLQQGTGNRSLLFHHNVFLNIVSLR